MATTLYDPAAGWKAHFLAARTDAAGTAADDALGEDLRTLIDAFYTEGVAEADAFQVLEDSPAGMTVVIGSGSAKSDHAVIDGDIAGQGAYLVRMEDATVDLTVPAADLSNPRIDEVYLVVQDTAYDSSSRVLPRIAYRDGTAATSPSAPGPDAAWDAYLLVATISVGAGVTSITNTDITDERVPAAYEGPNGQLVEGQIDNKNLHLRVPTSGRIAQRVNDVNVWVSDATEHDAGGLPINFVGNVDGVDVSAHAADINAHHAQSHAHDGIDGSGTVAHADTTGKTANDHHPQDHASRHGPGGADELIGLYFEVDNSTEVASVALTTTFANVASVTLSIPASWNSWKCTAWATWQPNFISASTYDVLLRIDGTDQQEMSNLGRESEAASLVSRRTGMTTTGSRTVSLRAQEIVGDMEMTDVTLYARAVRTS